MRALKFAGTSDLTMDQYGVKKTVQPNAYQVSIMQQLQSATGIEITQDRRVVAQILAHSPKARGAFTQAHPMSAFDNEGITMNCDADLEYWWSVLFHELAHATGTKDRLNRSTIAKSHVRTSRAEYMAEEVVAEKTAAKLMEFFGLATTSTRQSNHHYIESHLLEAQMFGTYVTETKIDSEVQDALSMVMYWLESTDLVKKAAA
jgi:superfamily II RNA helicase